MARELTSKQAVAELQNLGYRGIVIGYIIDALCQLGYWELIPADSP